MVQKLNKYLMILNVAAAFNACGQGLRAIPVEEVNYSTPQGTTETCKLLQAFPIAAPDGTSVYSPKDIEKVQELCALDIHPNATQDIGLCAKNYNTQPALEFYELPEGMDKKTFEETECPKSGKDGNRAGDKLAKHKQNLYGKQADSGLIYFHLSRILGSPTMVPAATYRTIDKSVALTYAKYGATLKGKIGGGWRVLRDKINHNSESILVRPENEVVFGSLQENPKGEEYNTYLRGSTNGVPNSYFYLATSSQPLSQLINKNTATPEDISNIQRAQDATLAMFLDYTLQQNDRHSGNMHSRAYFTYRDSEGLLKTERLNSEEYAALKKLRKKKAHVLASEVYAEAKTKNKKNVPDTAIALERLLLKDNDDALETKRPFAAYITKIRHLNPRMYSRMKWLAGLLRDPNTETTLKNYFTHAVGMTAPAYQIFKTNFLASAETFERLEQSGDLHLDLNFEDYL